MKKLLTILFLSTNLAQAEECPNASPWGEIRGAFVGAWAGNQLGGSGLWTIGGAIVGSYVGEKVEQAITCNNNQVYESDAHKLCHEMGFDNPTCWTK